MRSLRDRLLFRSTAVLVLIFLVAAVSLHFLMRQSLLTELDAALLLEARSLSTQVEFAANEVHVEPEVMALPEYTTGSRSHFFQVFHADGVSLFRSDSLSQHDLLPPSHAPLPSTFASIRLPDQSIGRSISLRFQPHTDDERESESSATAIPWVTLVVARETSQMNATLTRLNGLLAIVTIAATMACVLLTRRVVQRELEPLRTLAMAIQQVRVTNLYDLIHIADCPGELLPVTNCLNDLLTRLQQAMTREKSFTADVAHELRTPIAGLETTLEVCASRPRDVAGYQAAIDNCLTITRGMHTMVDTLLQLARTESQQYVLELKTSNIGDLLRECWSPLAGRAAERGLHVEWSIDDSACAHIDREAVRLVFANLLDNATSYVATNGQLRLAVTDRGSQIVITVANNGCALDAAQVSHVFDRYWRGDASRAGSGQHCGLGLALCKQLVEMHQGTITAEARDGWFTMTQTFWTTAPQTDRLL